MRHGFGTVSAGRLPAIVPSKSLVFAFLRLIGAVVYFFVKPKSARA
jgi:hypothetical protein